MKFSSFRSLLLSASAGLALVTSPAIADPADELLKSADVYDQKLQAKEALKIYLEAEKLEPKNPKIPTRIARQYRHLMADASTTSEKIKLGKTALEYSRRAASLGPNDSEAQLSIAISLGKLLPLLSSGEQVDASPKIKASADRAIALDPSNDLAWHILGRWHRNLADISPLKRTLAGALYGKLPAGSNEEAAKCLEKACSLDKTRLIHPIELGRVYAQMGRKEDAKRMINKGLAMPNTEKDDPEAKEKGRETLGKL